MKKHAEGCPCGSGKKFTECCAIYLSGKAFAPTAEALMRSRYTAYTLLREDYLLATWHASKRPATLGLADEQQTKWIGLEVKRHEQQDADHAIVEFVAKYKVNGKAHCLHEVSRFICEAGQWFYVAGDLS
ncbi:MAG: YchJ family metal-binding protein [Gallionellaceae bacterium]|nr:YchJ family metal-binding protein [Gallionellaceae bacterium]